MERTTESERSGAAASTGSVAVLLIGIVLSSPLLGIAGTAPADGELQVHGEFLEPGENVSAGGASG